MQQVCGFCGDGVYEHCSVTQKLEKKMEQKLIYTWDYMHKVIMKIK